MPPESGSLSSAQSDIVRQVFNAGNKQLPSTLKMIFGRDPEGLEVHSRVLPLSNLAREFGHDPLTTVQAGFSGDLDGVFLLLQREPDLGPMKAALQAALGGPIHTTNEATDYLVPDWLQERRAQAADDGKFRDALGELGNVLLGSYLTAVYTECSMATFQDLPETRLNDTEQEWLNEAIETRREHTDRAFVSKIDCRIGEHPIRFALVLIAANEGLHAMIDSMSA